MNPSESPAFPPRTIVAFIGLLVVSGLSVEYFPIDPPQLGSLFGLAYNMMINGLVFLLAAFKAFRLPQNYYVIRAFERHGEIYRPFGVHVARKILRVVGFVKFRGGRSSLSDLDDQMVFAEKNHVICFALNVILIGYAGIQGIWYLAFSLLIFNVLLNVYPIISLRFGRAKLQELRRRFGVFPAGVPGCGKVRMRPSAGTREPGS